jgi:hypothetical protein
MTISVSRNKFCGVSESRQTLLDQQSYTWPRDVSQKVSRDHHRPQLLSADVKLASFAEQSLAIPLITAYCLSATVVEEDRSCTISVPTTVRLNIRPPADEPFDDDNYDRGRRDAPVRCGSPTHPWILEAQTGQRINIRLLDFVQQRRRRSRWLDEVNDSQPETVEKFDRWIENCAVQYGYIVDKAVTSAFSLNTTICAAFGAGLPRDRFVYQSRGSTVEIVLTDSQPRDKDRFTYLISFEGTSMQHENVDLNN